MPRMTVYKLAKKAGVSIATISRAMNPSTEHLVAPDTLKKVRRLAESTGYSPNFAARSLGASSFKTLGVLLPHFSGIFFSDYYAKVLSGISDAVIGSGYVFKLIMVSDGGKWAGKDFRSAEGVDGLVVTHWPNFFSRATELENLGLPAVVINDPEPDVRAYFVSADNYGGGKLAAEHLLALGHREFALVTGPEWSSDSRLREKGFCDAAKRADIPPARIHRVCAGFQEAEGEARTAEFLKTKESSRVTAFFCLNDLMAFGAMRALSKARLRCPDDVSVVGYDDDRLAAISLPALTTVGMPLYDMSREAALLLLSYLKNSAHGNWKGIQLHPSKLIERFSTSRARPRKAA